MNCYKCATPIPDNSRFCSACGADVSGEGHQHAGAGDTIAVDDSGQLQRALQTELGTEFVVERELGRGGMAVVFLGHDTLLNRKIAVKVLPPELTFSSKSMTERFKREAQTAAKLDHPNIIPVHRVSPGGKLIWYVMKYLEGEALDDILEREGQLAVDRTVDIISQVASALDYAHQNKVVHRDVKPANIIVDKNGRCTVTDFGIAKALDADTLTASGSIIGTPYYMSPEQCKGKKVGPAADQYSLAVMTYQMLGGHVPFTGDSAVEIVHKHVADPVPPLGILRPELPETVVAVVEKALAKDAEGRFPTVADFAKALKAASQGLDVTLAPPGKKTPTRMSKTALVSPVPGALRTAKGSVRERKGLWIGGSLVGVIAAAAVVVTVVLPRLRQGAAPEQTALPDTAKQAAAQPAPVDTAPPAAQDTTPAAAPSAAAPAARTGRIVLTGVPSGATITLDGRRMSGPRFQAEAGRRHTVSVSRQGYETWTRPVTPQAGEATTLAVAMTAVPGAQQPTAAPVVTQQATPANQPAAQPPAQPSAAPSQPTAAAPTTGCISAGTRPASVIHVNGTPRGRVLRNETVPPGTVHLTFQVTDSTGVWWAQPRDVTVTAGTTCTVLGFITLVRQ